MVCTTYWVQYRVYIIVRIVDYLLTNVSLYYAYYTMPPTILHCTYETYKLFTRHTALCTFRLSMLHETSVQTLHIALSDYSLHAVLYCTYNDEYQIMPSLLYYIVHAIQHSSVLYISGVTYFCNAILQCTCFIYHTIVNHAEVHSTFHILQDIVYHTDCTTHTLR